MTLALGIGANTALFSLVNTVLLTPPPYPDAGRLVRIWSSMPERGVKQSSTSMPDYRLMRDQNRMLEGLGAYMQTNFNVSEERDPERVFAARVSAGVGQVLKVEPVAGRWFSSADETWGEHRVVLLSEGFWRRRFAGNPDAVGRTLVLDEEPYTIAGIMPESFRFPDARTQLWVPLSFAPQSDRNTRDNYYLDMVGRLRPGAAREQAEADLVSVVRAANQSIGAAVMDLQESRSAMYGRRCCCSWEE